jgi:hypothetical protein
LSGTVIAQRASDNPGGAGLARLRLCSPTAFTKASKVVFALVVLLFAATRLRDLTSYGLFSDEVFSAQTVTLGWREMIQAVIRDVVHPPLFYLLLKAWVVTGGSSLLWMKLFPVAVAIGSIIPFCLLCRELRLKAATINLALFIMAVNEYLVSYAQELRMYSLLCLLAVTSLWLFARLVNSGRASKKIWLALFAANLLLVCAHYYGWLVVAVEFLFLLMARRDLARPFFLSLAGLAACFAPWAFAVAEAAADKGGLGPNLNWNVRPKPVDLAWFYAILDGPVYNRWKAWATLFATALFIAPALVWAWRAIRGTKAEGRAVLAWLALASFAPAVIAFLLSMALPQSIWGTRFLIIVAPPYILLLSIAATGLRPSALRFSVAALMALWAGISGGVQLANRDKIAWEPLVQRMIEAEPDRPGVTKVYASQGVAGTTIQYYLDRAGQKRLQVAYVDQYAEPQEAHFWVAYLKYGHENYPPPQAALTERGYKVGDVIEADAPGHKVFLFPAWR